MTRLSVIRIAALTALLGTASYNAAFADDPAVYKDIPHHAVCMTAENAIEYMHGNGWKAILAGTENPGDKITTAIWVNDDATKYAMGELHNGEYCFFGISEVHKKGGIDGGALSDIFNEQMGWQKS